ncbi:MAG: glycosyltransferase 87 family protein [Spirochaetaceae bacterium]|nr:glycosyltransferase 87 family protein [Spirochaetaceae bacterium]
MAHRRTLSSTAVVPWLLLVVAFLARLVPVLRGGGLHGILAYDDGVYFGAADSLLSGRLPYRDFLFLHPPGVLLVLAPFTGLARVTSDPTGFAVARLAFMAVGALNAVLAYAVARRAGRVAGIAAGVLYALWGPAVYAERTTLLEPLVNLGVLGALALLGDGRSLPRRRLVLAGVVLGAAVAVKLWAVMPLVVIVVWVLRRSGRSAGLVLTAAAAVTSATVVLPFLAAAPRAMVRMVVLDQLGRPDNGVSTLVRLSGVTGNYHAAGSTLHTATLLTVAVVVALVAVSAVAAAVAAPTARVWVAMLVAQSGLLLAGPAYYDHYATFIAPALVLVVGTGVELLVTRVRERVPRLVPVAAVACLAGLALVAVTGPVHREGRRVPTELVAAAVGSARCVRADSTSALIATDLLTRDLRRDCPLTVDVTGLTYDLASSQLDEGRPGASRRTDAAWQHFLRHWVSRDGPLIVVQPGADGYGPAARALLRSNRVLLRTDQLTVYAE